MYLSGWGIGGTVSHAVAVEETHVEAVCPSLNLGRDLLWSCTDRLGGFVFSVLPVAVPLSLVAGGSEYESFDVMLRGS